MAATVRVRIAWPHRQRLQRVRIAVGYRLANVAGAWLDDPIHEHAAGFKRRAVRVVPGTPRRLGVEQRVGAFRFDRIVGGLHDVVDAAAVGIRSVRSCADGFRDARRKRVRERLRLADPDLRDAFGRRFRDVLEVRNRIDAFAGGLVVRVLVDDVVAEVREQRRYVRFIEDAARDARNALRVFVPLAQRRERFGFRLGVDAVYAFRFTRADALEPPK
jgi:hypothetical protein